ncbi:hypothetical protein LTR08_007301 [Meristemomyces frigidus]|nr:hypothetical protein LTR08_007301 [Meristemomyces frigidus]
MARNKRTKKKTPTPRSTNEKQPTDVAPLPVPITQQDVPLLLLPAELFNTICELVLINDVPIHIEDTAAARAPALLHTCRQIRTEASKIFYGQTTFVGTLGVDAYMPNRSIPPSKSRTKFLTFSYLRAIGTENSSYIKRVVLRWTNEQSCIPFTWKKHHKIGYMYQDRRGRDRAKQYAATYVDELRRWGVGMDSVICTAASGSIDERWVTECMQWQHVASDYMKLSWFGYEWKREMEQMMKAS